MFTDKDSTGRAPKVSEVARADTIAGSTSTDTTPAAGGAGASAEENNARVFDLTTLHMINDARKINDLLLEGIYQARPELVMAVLDRGADPFVENDKKEKAADIIIRKINDSKILKIGRNDIMDSYLKCALFVLINFIKKNDVTAFEELINKIIIAYTGKDPENKVFLQLHQKAEELGNNEIKELIGKKLIEFNNLKAAEANTETEAKAKDRVITSSPSPDHKPAIGRAGERASAAVEVSVTGVDDKPKNPQIDPPPSIIQGMIKFGNARAAGGGFASSGVSIRPMPLSKFPAPPKGVVGVMPHPNINSTPHGAEVSAGAGSTLTVANPAAGGAGVSATKEEIAKKVALYGKEFLGAIKAGSLDEVKDLVENKGFPPEFLDKKGFNSLAHAAYNRQVEVLKYLIPKVKRINTQAESGNTALHIAAISKSFPCVEALLIAGADISLLNKSGKNPTQFAIQNSAPQEIIKILLDYEAEKAAELTAGSGGSVGLDSWFFHGNTEFKGPINIAPPRHIKAGVIQKGGTTSYQYLPPAVAPLPAATPAAGGAGAGPGSHFAVASTALGGAVPTPAEAAAVGEPEAKRLRSDSRRDAAASNTAVGDNLTSGRDYEDGHVGGKRRPLGR